MKRFYTLFVIALLATCAVAQVSSPIKAEDYGKWTLKSLNSITTAAGQVLTFPPSSCRVDANGRSIMPLATTAPVTVLDGSNSDTLTPSAVTYDGSTCSLTGTFTHAHAAGVSVVSGTAGLQESINSLNAGTVNVTPNFTGVFSTLIASATGTSGVYVEDTTGLPRKNWAWNGSAYVQGALFGPGASHWAHFVGSELVTLATGATTTDTTANLLPANSLIDMVQGVVNTTITSACTGWELGDATTAARFTANDTTLTAGEAKNGVVMLTTGVASATTGPYQAAAAKVRITCAGGNPGAGKVRVIVYGRTWTSAVN